MYCCPEKQTTSFGYATRCRILCRNERGPIKQVWAENYFKPTTQFIFRGIEQPQGKAALDDTKDRRHQLKRERDFGGETQLIYSSSNMVKWTELQVWIGVSQRDTAELGIFECPGGFENSRRGSRLARPYLTFTSDPRWIPNADACGHAKTQQEQQFQQREGATAGETSGSNSVSAGPMEEC